MQNYISKNHFDKNSNYITFKKKNQPNDYFFIILMLILYLCIFIHLNLSSKHIILYL
jgi:hypothetical protein